MDPDIRGHRLIQAGAFLFLLGLLIGFVIPATTNPRMALSSHLEGVMNGMLLMVLGLLWDRLRLGEGALHALFALAVFGTFANVVATLLAAVWGAGAAMPIAAGSFEGSPLQEAVIMILLGTLSLAMVAALVLVLLGLRRPS